MAGQRANKGVFITTSAFSQQAINFAGSVERIVLVDGSKLAELMIEHEVGVVSRPIKVPKTWGQNTKSPQDLRNQRLQRFKAIARCSDRQ